MNYALDACAVIAYLKGEPGGNVVASLLTDPSVTCYAHMINLVEVYYDFIRRADEASARTALKVLREDGVIERRDMSRSFALQVARLKARGRISLADCFCITLALDLKGAVFTSDHHEFDPLVALRIVPVTFIR